MSDIKSINIPEQMWRTKDGFEIPFSKVTQEHWSNIYWYHLMVTELYTKNYPKLLPEIQHAKNISLLAKNELYNRFNGVILDWIPVYNDEKHWYKSWCTRTILIEKFKC